MEDKKEKKGSISMVEANLTPGFRFHPRDDELICDYLMRRTVCSLYQPVVLIEVDLNKCEPWEVPQLWRRRFIRESIDRYWYPKPCMEILIMV